MKQTTIKDKISFSGVGLHSGVKTDIVLTPADVDTGVKFKIDDIYIDAVYNNVVETNLGTTIGIGDKKILTIEHLMAALWACDIDNIIVEINNQETPIMDGSAQVFVDQIKKTELIALQKDRKFLKILKKIEISDNDKIISVEPYDCFAVDITVDYKYGNINQQNYIFDGQKETFLAEIAKARTFCQEKEIEYMRSIGLARGGSLDNAMVFNDNGIINNGGFRCENEVVKHKLLDLVGDMYTSGYNILGRIKSVKGGHTLNNLLLKKIFENKDNYTII